MSFNGTHEFTGINIQEKVIDKQNFDLLKYDTRFNQNGEADYFSAQIYKQQYRQNQKHQKALIKKIICDDFGKNEQRVLLASNFFIVYIHCFYYESFPTLVALKDNAERLTEYAKYSSYGIPPSQIIDEIKSVYPSFKYIQ
ncbi:hypothetical protein ABPG72_012106 [Tetrahymena utriculariae]